MKSDKRKFIQIGVDFDGVVAYNPARVVRRIIKIGKRIFLGKKKVSFMIPRGTITKFLWVVAHKSSVFPAKGVELLKQLSKDKNIKLHLITGRFPILDEDLMKWLDRHEIKHIFTSINSNKNCAQPHEFKLETINKLELDFFIEDNLDIVEYLETRTPAKILWIYNILDFGYRRKDKFSCLEEALRTIVKQ